MLDAINRLTALVCSSHVEPKQQQQQNYSTVQKANFYKKNIIISNL